MESGVLGMNGGLSSPPSILVFPALSVTWNTTSFRIPSNLPSNFTIISAAKCNPHPKYSVPSSKSPKTRSISRSARETAIRNIQNSSNFSSALTRSGEVLKVPDLNVVLRCFGRSRRWKDLFQLFEWMRKHGKINAASYSSYMKFMAESKDVSGALTAYEAITDEAMRNNISICNSVLSCMMKNKKFDMAVAMFQQMKESGLMPDLVTYSTLLAGCLKAEHGYTKALQLLEELEDKGILMDSVAYGTLIAVCASHCKCEEAEMYFMRMKSEGHSPNIYHYSSLLNAYSVDGNYQKADKLFQDMQSAGVMPNKVVLTTLLKVYVSGGLIDKSKLLLFELEALGYAQDEMPYCQLLDGLSKSGKIDEARMVFNQMNKRQVLSDGYAHSIMISAYCRAGQLEEAKRLAKDYEAVCSKYDLVILNVLLCAYCRAGEMENVMQILRKMDKLAIFPDRKTFQILIKYFVKEKLYLLAYRTMQDMHNKGHYLEEEVLSSLLLHLGRIGAHFEAFTVYNIMKTREKTICKVLHEEVLHILIAGHLLEEAYAVFKVNVKLMSPEAVEKFLAAFLCSGNAKLYNEVLQAVHISGHVIKQDMFHLAISRYVTQPELSDELLQLLQWMPKHGYLVDSATRNLILKNSKLYGDQVIAEILPQHHGVKVAFMEQRKFKITSVTR